MNRPLLSLLLPFVVAFGCRERHPQAALVLSPDYEKGVSFLSRRIDSAYYYLNKAATGSKDSLQIAQAYNMMGVIQDRAGDYYGGQESLLTSLKYLHADREYDVYCLVADYNELGSTSLNLKNYGAAIEYYDSAYKWAKDEGARTIARNNKALAYQKKGDYNAAIALYDSIIPGSRADEKEYARVLSNRARVRWLRDPGYRAAPELLAALAIREKVKDHWGLNASYSHLADYYGHSRPDSALGYAREMVRQAGRLGSPEDELEALEKLMNLSPGREVKAYFTRYRELKDSLETARNGAKNQFALIRYEAERNKTENLRLQRENAERQVEVVRQRALSIGVVVAFLMLIGWGIFWFRKRRQRLEWEKDAAVRDERLQLSQRIHDVVANGIYRVMTEIEHGENWEKDHLLDQLDGLYVQSRDISYEPTGAEGDFQAVVARILAPYGTTGRKVLITGNDQDLWRKIKQGTKKILEPILQELMVNMDKHSRARNVVIRFEREGGELKVTYSDDGVGFPPDHRFGNGLTNTGNRISGIGGRIIFEENSPSGIRVLLFFPMTDLP